MKLNTNKKEWITIPFSNDSQNITDCLPVHSCTVVPTKKSLTPSFLIRGFEARKIGLAR